MKFLLFITSLLLTACIFEDGYMEGECFKLEARQGMYWDTVKTGAGTIILINDVVRDTVSLDFIAELKDIDTRKPISHATVSIDTMMQASSNAEGLAELRNFAAHKQSVNISIRAEGYECLSIKNMPFESGQVKWFEFLLVAKDR